MDRDVLYLGGGEEEEEPDSLHYPQLSLLLGSDDSGRSRRDSSPKATRLPDSRRENSKLQTNARSEFGRDIFCLRDPVIQFVHVIGKKPASQISITFLPGGVRLRESKGRKVASKDGITSQLDMT